MWKYVEVYVCLHVCIYIYVYMCEIIYVCGICVLQMRSLVLCEQPYAVLLHSWDGLACFFVPCVLHMRYSCAITQETRATYKAHFCACSGHFLSVFVGLSPTLICE